MYDIVHTEFNAAIKIMAHGWINTLSGNNPLNLQKPHLNGEMDMKPYYFLVLIITATILALPACEQKQTSTGKVMDKVDDALDRRSDEKIRDAAEDVGDALKDAGKEIKEGAKDATN